MHCLVQRLPWKHSVFIEETTGAAEKHQVTFERELGPAPTATHSSRFICAGDTENAGGEGADRKRTGGGC